MNKFKYFKLIKEKLSIIILITISSIIISTIATLFFIEPTYESKISVIIGPNQSTSGDYSSSQSSYDVVMYQKMVKTYSELLTSKIVLQDVIENTGLDLNLESLESMIKIKTTTESEFINITVEGKVPEVTTLVANQLTLSLKNISSEIRGVDNVILVDSASIPEKPTKPNIIINISLSFILGLIFSISLVVLINYLDQRIKDKDELKELITFPILGEIPDFSSVNINNKGNYLFVNESPKSLPSEAINILRTNLQFCNVNYNLKKILITSSSPSEGKSTIISNLGISMALTNKKVIIIDCDMRKPKIHRIFSLSNIIGLSHILSNQAELEECLQSSGINNLSILTAGVIPPNPSELISSNGMKILLDRLTSNFDFILIDSPPLPLVADSQALSTFVDGTIIITKLGYTTKSALLNTKEILDGLKTNVIGVVLNNSPLDSSVNYYYQ
ncbi:MULTISPECIES: polysaccharide biosynthesis tyrosine autokinase [Clostridium]|uniref:non-specific protein-tyrosine kinase n=1 Tax=Clostridium disporicum TaxID=84024 RepID=A0A174DL89_9CLOT|nr:MULTISPECIES: polysaccharide biosynthesis tyrosine autokinase [Clostridium]MCD2500495.1 polysaccharide biosynthesis tyrosine autokinase [Clostridium sp. NSJ-145]CUO24895.1 lipopolysaccharide biosynthesis protein [Clostridium disporicum]